MKQATPHTIMLKQIEMQVSPSPFEELISISLKQILQFSFYSHLILFASRSR